MSQLVTGGHKNDSNSAASLPDDLHQIPKFYLFNKIFHTAHEHVSCTTKTNTKKENTFAITSQLVFI